MRAAGFVLAVTILVAAVVLAFVGLSLPESRTHDTVRVGVLPDQDVAALRSTFEPLLYYLTGETHRDFELVIPDDYQKLVTLFNEGRVDLAYFGGLTYVQARRSSGAVPLVMRETDTRFTTTFIVRDEAPWNTCLKLACSELKGAVLTFGARLSTSGHLMPRHFLQTELGIVPEEFFGKVRYSGAHDRTAMDVRSGVAEIGAINSAILNAMFADGRIAPGELAQIWESPPYADYVWAIQKNVDDGTAAEIRDAFLALNEYDETANVILHGLRASSFIPASVRDFELLQSVAERSGLLARP